MEILTVSEGKKLTLNRSAVFPKPVTQVYWSITLQALVHLLLRDYKSVHIAFIHRWENQGTGQVGHNWDHTSSKREGLCFQTAVYREVRVVGCESPDKTAPAAHPELRPNCSLLKHTTGLSEHTCVTLFPPILLWVSHFFLVPHVTVALGHQSLLELQTWYHLRLPLQSGDQPETAAILQILPTLKD